METLLSAGEITVQYRPVKNMNGNQIIRTSKDAYEVLAPFYPEDTFHMQESFVVLYMNQANCVIGAYRVSTGGLTGTVADVRLILSVALKTIAASLILSHNHPSGTAKPSKADEALTKKIKEAAQLHDIKVLDHIILTGEGEFFSFGDEGLM
jgi:DNA repair protein RadC